MPRTRSPTGRSSANGVKLAVTASVGGASWPDHGQTVGEVFEAADAALYRAKQAGRDRVELALRARVAASAGPRSRSAPPRLPRRLRLRPYGP